MIKLDMSNIRFTEAVDLESSTEVDHYQHREKLAE